MSQSSIRKFFGPGIKGIVRGSILAIGLASIFSVMLFGAWKLTSGPLYRTSSAAECQRKYANAKTLAETTTVDFQPYADSTGGRGLRCGMTRSTTLSGIK